MNQIDQERLTVVSLYVVLVIVLPYLNPEQKKFFYTPPSKVVDCTLI